MNFKPDNIEKSVEAWLKQAHEDLKTAEALLKSKRYTWCAFVCQQSLEKYLKAGYVKVHKKIPPYTHNLEYLCQLLGLNPPAKIMETIIRIGKYYIAARYPSYKKSVNISQIEVAEEIVLTTKETIRWLRKIMEFKN